MIVHIHGFDWETYTKRVMPAFAQWLVEGDDSQVYRLYEHTRDAREEQFLPPAMQTLRTWTRAQTFVKQLPQGVHTRREYHVLCSAEAFTAISDRYIHKHPPQLYQNTDALRTVWGTLVEEYCQSWFTLPKEADQQYTTTPRSSLDEQNMSRGEIISLLHSAGLSDLAREISVQSSCMLSMEADLLDDIEDEDELDIQQHGVQIGRHPNTLLLRGWLTTISLRAMALFELLACGRRNMPFGYRSGEPYEDYIGYLTPDEVWQLAQCLRHAQPPEQSLAEKDYQQFRQQQEGSKTFRMLDEVAPTQADTLLKVVRMAAQYGLGLICNG